MREQCQTAPGLLSQLAAEKLGRPPTELLPLANELFDKHHGNLRDALAEC